MGQPRASLAPQFLQGWDASCSDLPNCEEDSSWAHFAPECYVARLGAVFDPSHSDLKREARFRAGRHAKTRVTRKNGSRVLSHPSVRFRRADLTIENSGYRRKLARTFRFHRS